MKDIIAARGMVLSSMPVGEYDKRIVLLTRELGRVSAFARGAKRQNSPLLASTRPFTFGTFSLYPGRNTYTLQSSEVVEYFEELGNDMEGIAYGFYFLEVANYYTREGIDESAMLNLLYMTIKALLNPRLDDRLVRLIYELRAMVINGEYPDFFHCVSCGAELSSGFFSRTDFGIYGKECRSVLKKGIAIGEAACYALQYAAAAPLNRLYTFTLAPKALEEMGQIVEECRKRYLDREFHSLSILDQMLSRDDRY